MIKTKRDAQSSIFAYCYFFHQSYYMINFIVDENVNLIVVSKENFEKSFVTINNKCSSITRRFDSTIIECIQQINIIDLLNRFV